MKIALLAHSLFPLREPFAGGLEMITYHLTLALQRRGHEVTLFAHADSAPELNVRPYPTAQAIHAQLYEGELARELLTLREFTFAEQYAWAMTQVERGAFDLIHNHTMHHLPILLGERYGKRFITTIHAPPELRQKLGFRALPDGRQTVTCVSHHQRRCWEALTRVDATIHNGVDLTHWQPTDAPGDYFFWMGRICDTKAPGDAVQACRRAGKRLRLAGPIHDRHYFNTHVAPYLDDRITYLGHLTHAELAPHLAAARALVFTSVFEEPYGLTMAESLAAGTPVIGYAIGASPEIVDPSVGILVERGDVAGLQHAMQHIQQIDRRGCRAYARTHCSISAMVDGYERLYRKVCPSIDRTVRAEVAVLQ